MLDAVFISDLHLGPDTPEISAQFRKFCEWAATHTQSVYILGDFFHAWPGDDYKEDWLLPVHDALKILNQSGVKIYFMHGNRDFLLGKSFFSTFKITVLTDPTLIELNNQRVLLSHGDRYCTNDKKHQWFRRITRNRLFSRVFLWIPLKIRKKLVLGVRNYSERNKINQKFIGNTVPASICKDLQRYKCNTLIHGHTHKPALHKHIEDKTLFYQYVLSDWDDIPLNLYYNSTTGIYFSHR